MKNALLLALVILSFSGACMKKPNLADDPGSLATPQEIQKSLVDAWSGADPMEMKLNEYVAVDKEVVIETLAPKLVLKDDKTISQIKDDGEDRIFTLIQDTVEVKENNQQDVSSSVRSVAVKRSQDFTPAAIQPENVSLPLSIEKLYQLFLTCVPAEGWNVKCYNLKVSEETVPAPPTVAAREGCEGLPQCMIRKKIVSFDMIVDVLDPKTNAKTSVKQVYTIKISPDVPFLSRITDFCFQGVGSYKGTPYLATVCEKVVNFKHGDH